VVTRGTGPPHEGVRCRTVGDVSQRLGAQAVASRCARVRRGYATQGRASEEGREDCQEGATSRDCQAGEAPLISTDPLAKRGAGVRSPAFPATAHGISPRVKPPEALRIGLNMRSSWGGDVRVATPRGFDEVRGEGGEGWKVWLRVYEVGRPKGRGSESESGRASRRAARLRVGLINATLLAKRRSRSRQWLWARAVEALGPTASLRG
jgi:hypothetical protein